MRDTRRMAWTRYQPKHESHSCRTSQYFTNSTQWHRAGDILNEDDLRMTHWGAHTSLQIFEIAATNTNEIDDHIRDIGFSNDIEQQRPKIKHPRSNDIAAGYNQTMSTPKASHMRFMCIPLPCVVMVKPALGTVFIPKERPRALKNVHAVGFQHAEGTPLRCTHFGTGYGKGGCECRRLSSHCFHLGRIPNLV